jgi:hypothetical protein
MKENHKVDLVGCLTSLNLMVVKDRNMVAALNLNVGAGWERGLLV